MGGFILFFLFIVIFVILFVLSAGFSILRGILRIFTGNSGSQHAQRKPRNPNFDNQERANNSAKTNNGEKIFRKDEGEYVDFVEYKDEESRKS